MNAQFMEIANAKQAWAPVDMNTAAITGARIKMDAGKKLVIVVSMGASTGATVAFNLNQHNAASSGTTKDCSVNNPYFHKAGTATFFTKVPPTITNGIPVDAAAYDLSTLFIADGGIAVFEINAADLDVNNGFAWASISASDSAAAKLGSGMYYLVDCPFNPPYDQAI